MKTQSAFVIFTRCIKLKIYFYLHNSAQLWEDFPSKYLNRSSGSGPAHRSATLSQENIHENHPETLQKTFKKNCQIRPPLPPPISSDWFLCLFLSQPQPSSVKLSFICSQYILFTSHCPLPTPTFGNTSQRKIEQPRYWKVWKSEFYIEKLRITTLITNCYFL